MNLKKVLPIIAMVLIFICTSTAANATQCITLIYLNGSNDYSAKNREKFKDSFKNDVNKMHPNMVKLLSEDETIQTRLLKNGEYTLNPTPLIFYWGDKSISQVEHIDKGLNISKFFTPKIAQTVRSVFAHCLHDAIWIQKYQNMTPVINELHTLIKSETDKGNKVILLGYSAGSFITYQYFINKSPSIIPKNLISHTNDSELINLAKLNPRKPTCLDAIMDSNMVTLKPNGQLDFNHDKNIIKEAYNKLDSYTEAACFCDSSIKGVINFASPFMLFYSDVVDNTTSLNRLSQLMFKNIVENDIFFLTVNFRNDPLGYPVEKNITLQDIKNANKEINPNNGFFYTKSDVYTTNSFITAHMAYWSKSKRFVKGVIKAYKDGYNHFYGVTVLQSVSYEQPNN